ncbi:MAG: integration host factor subunit beta [Bacteroidales bacterium]|jgi:DNA-binding protein HU-beta|nr:integration host factor subunit beta [Bacteroidales bacterium]
MKKAEIIKKISDRGINKADVSIVLETFMEIVKDSLKEGEEVTLRGFGTFKLKRRKEKIARDIAKNKSIKVPAHNIPIFKPSNSLKEVVK